MNDISSDDIFLLRQRLAEQEALIHALQEKLADREREIDHLQAQLGRLRRMNFGRYSEKVSRRITQMETDLNQVQKKTLTLLVEWITRQYSVRRSSFVIIPLREKHACTKFGAIVQVPAPSRPIERVSQDWRC